MEKKEYLFSKRGNWLFNRTREFSRMKGWFSISSLWKRRECLDRQLGDKDLRRLFGVDNTAPNDQKFSCSICGEQVEPIQASVVNPQSGALVKNKHSEKKEPLMRGNFLATISGNEVNVECFCDTCITEARVLPNGKKLPAQNWEQAHQRAEHLKKMFEPKPASPRLAQKPAGKKGMTVPIGDMVPESVREAVLSDASA